MARKSEIKRMVNEYLAPVKYKQPRKLKKKLKKEVSLSFESLYDSGIIGKMMFLYTNGVNITMPKSKKRIKSALNKL